MKTKTDILNSLCILHSYFLDGKRVKYHKLKEILKNNYSDRTMFKTKSLRRALKWYKGDFEYYSSWLSNRGIWKTVSVYRNNRSKLIIYIESIKDV